MSLRALAACIDKCRLAAIAAERCLGVAQPRPFFSWATKKEDKYSTRERNLGNVRWEDEYAWLGREDLEKTKRALAEEERRVREHPVVKSALHRTLFDEICTARSTYIKHDEPVERRGRKYYVAEHPDMGTAWVKEDADGNITVLISADLAELGDRFHDIVDLKLNEQEDKVFALVNDGLHTDAYTLIIKPVGPTSVCYSGTMTAADVLEAVHTAEWMRDGQHITYTRVGAAATPRDVWMHTVGQEEYMDRLLFEEDMEGFHVHVAQSSDGEFVTVTAASRTSTEVHMMSASDPEAALEVIQERKPGLMYWVTHAHGALVVMHNAWNSPDYDIAVAPAPSSTGDAEGLGMATWRPLVHRAPATVIEDIVAYRHSLVISARERGLPVLFSLPWAHVPGVARTHESQVASSTTQNVFDNDHSRSAQGQPAATLTAASYSLLDASGALTLSELPRLPLPRWAASVVPGVALGFDAAVHTIVASSPSHPERQLQFELETSRLLEVGHDVASHSSANSPVDRAPPGDPSDMLFSEAAVKRAALICPFGLYPGEMYPSSAELPNLRVERMECDVLDEPTQSDYLQLLYSLDETSASTSRADQLGEEEVHDPLVEAAIHDDKMSITLVYDAEAAADRRREDGHRPLVLRAYGAYGVNADLTFQPDDLCLLSRGVAIATAHVRGGGEHGRRWHLAAVGHHKWASLYDYVAALHALVATGAARSGQVALDSFSAGSLVAAHVFNRAPHNFAAGLFRRPFVTLLNSMTDPSLPMTSHDYEEWGDPEDPSICQLWTELCPHNSMVDADMPPALVTAGFKDSRVEWWSPVKYAWRLRAKQTGERSVLLWLSGDGHYVQEPTQIAMEKHFLLMYLTPEVIEATISEPLEEY